MHKLDSLNLVLKEAKQDSTVASTYLELSDILYVSNIDTLEYFNTKALSISKKNLALNISEEEEKRFLEISSTAINNLGYG